MYENEEPRDRVTAPLCDYCWSLEGDYELAFKLKEEVVENERCSNCGDQTNSGIYIRYAGYGEINIKDNE